MCPTLDAVLDIFAAAAECQVQMHPETSWNMLVHEKVLRLATASCWAPAAASRCVRFLPCTTAKIISTYQRGGAGSSKMVDFALYLDTPSLDADYVDRSEGQEGNEEGNGAGQEGNEAAVHRARRFLPGTSINHTDFAPLRNRPIALSIESKTTGQNLLEAELQVGVWLAAQWKMLERLEQQGNNNNKGILKPGALLPLFLPAVIVQGHDWHFVATTRSKGKTVCINYIPSLQHIAISWLN